LKWLIEITDPFHDTEIETVGHPDLTTVRSITQCYTFTTNVSALVSVGTSTWDCQVLFAPVTPLSSGNLGLAPCAISASSCNLGSSSASFLTPGWGIYSGANGFDLATASNTLVVVNNSLTIPNQVASGQYRIVAAAVEVKNTTPSLYRGGSVTAWRAPSMTPQTAYVYNSPSTTTTPITVMCSNAPPTTLAKAQVYPSSRTWGAEEGLYSVASLCAAENPFIIAGPVAPPPVFLPAPSLAQIIANSTLNGWAWPNFAQGVTLNNIANMGFSIIPFNWQGAIFAGLNSNSTLQVTARYVVERVPSVSEPDYLVLTRPPADYDPLALEIYTRATTKLPVAVTVGENPLGEWFNDVLEVVGEWAPKIGNFIGGAAMPIGSVIGAGAKTVLQQRQPVPEQKQEPTESFQPAEKKPNKKKKKNQPRTNRNGRKQQMKKS